MIGLNRPLDTTTGLKLLGERNSGTNFLETLLRDHFDLRLFENIPILGREMIPAPPAGPFLPGPQGHAAREAMIDIMHDEQLPRNGGWKHAAPLGRFRTEFLAAHSPAVLILVRHPASWCLSMHRNPFHTLLHVPENFSAFLRQPWITLPRDALPARHLASLPALLAAKWAAYADLLGSYENSSLILYEDLVQAPEDTLRAIGLAPTQPIDTSRNDREAREFLPRKRWFRLRGTRTDFRAKAVLASYDQLSSEDAEFVQNTLSESVLNALYPK